MWSIWPHLWQKYGHFDHIKCKNMDNLATFFSNIYLTDFRKLKVYTYVKPDKNAEITIFRA